MVSTVFEQTMSLKESMWVHEELLNLAFAEEEAVLHRIKVLEDKLKILHKKREDFCLSNKDEIS
ncbi:hypothetical protein A2U01_0106231, partial [Trifolium medium]|nr:hypothetical protein [Trifolium medium]